MDVQAKKSLGQHFLADPRICKKIVHFADVRPADVIVEVGPGTGNLTEFLLEAGAFVIALELDRRLVERLCQRWSSLLNERLIVLEADALAVDWSELLDSYSLFTARPVPAEKAGRSPSKIPHRKSAPPPLGEGPSPAADKRLKFVGNLPYNIATRLLTRTIPHKARFHSFTFMVQREVARRILAQPGSGDYGFLALLMEYHFDRIRGFDVPPGAFVPRPDVFSHVMKLLPLGRDHQDPAYADLFDLISRAFRHRRKTLLNNLKSRTCGRDRLSAAFKECGISEKSRPQTLTLEQFRCLARML